MTVNVCMIARGRLGLTAQAINSLYLTSNSSMFNFTVVDDASHPDHQFQERVSDTVDYCDPTRENSLVVRLSRSKGIVGLVRNLSIQLAEQYWGRGDYLYLTDNDVYFEPAWLERMTAAIKTSGADVLGGYRHPYHGINNDMLVGNGSKVEFTDAVAGYSMLMRWETWDKYGPFDSHMAGIGMSEDFAFCRKIVEAGGKVGYIDPPAIVMCGLTNTDGKPAVGAEQFPRVEGVLQL